MTLHDFLLFALPAVFLTGLSKGGFGGALGGELSSVLPVHAPAGVGTYPAGITAGAISFGAATDKSALELLGSADLQGAADRRILAAAS